MNLVNDEYVAAVGPEQASTTVHVKECSSLVSEKCTFERDTSRERDPRTLVARAGLEEFAHDRRRIEPSGTVDQKPVARRVAGELRKVARGQRRRIEVASGGR
jgi:hypothetical protein